MSATAATVLDGDAIGRALRRMAHEILERHHGPGELLLLGIPTRGVPLAARLARAIGDIEGHRPPAGSLDVTLYRDDYARTGPRPLGETEAPGGVDDRVVVLVDDVLYTGRTIRAALDALTDLGRPRAVQLAVLVDRGHRELPLRADYVGKNLPTGRDDDVRVHLAEADAGAEADAEADAHADADAEADAVMVAVKEAP
jgi:pyrimidine operon attenuation protein/uracil phosphoribosyltransferase